MTSARPDSMDGLRVRRAPIPPDALLLVRGDSGSAAVTQRQAQRFLRRYPAWGRYRLSAFHVRDDNEIDDLAAAQLQSFPSLGLFRLADLEAAGFEVVPTFGTPHVTVAFTGDLDTRLRDLAYVRLAMSPNPYHVAATPLVGTEEEDR